MNAKTVKLFRKYAKQQSKNPEIQKKYYKKLKAEFKAFESAHR